ncbi:hypothetical protein [Anabaena lutea]|uniref:Uncharacterized protein n=1 Tax=Anabaena lutea FACHB-196 TaxID=2692881 RepID=A0ABR8FJ69_9NOST|nr:hypothetical protein [Anabaena lutea]MBD2570033.1 hypothetical protein [Anabaena lutea FACHB-196]
MITPEKVLLALQENQGANNGLRAKDLVELLTGYAAKPSDERYLRQVVSALRIQGFPILATPERGYYWPTDVNEIELACLWLRKRAMTHLWMVSKLKRFGIPMLTGQMTLPIPIVIPAIPQMEQPNEEEVKEQVKAIFMVVPNDVYEAVQDVCQKLGKTDEEIASTALAVYVSGLQAVLKDMEEHEYSGREAEKVTGTDSYTEEG